MPWFYVDDAFADSKPVMALDRVIRNEAVGLWVRCGAWSAKEETDGRVPLDIVKQFGGTPRVIRALHENAQLWVENSPESWRDSREILFGNWAKWQKTRAENQARRKREAEKKSTWRAGKKGRDYVATSQDSEMSTGDNTGDAAVDSESVSTGDSPGESTGESLYPDPTRPDPLIYSGNEEHSPNVGGDERGLSTPVNPSASRLVSTLVPPTVPSTVRAGLRIQASQLMNGDGLDSDVVAEALRRWLAKPGTGVGLLPHLAADVIRERATPNPSGRNGSKLRGYAQLAAEVRAQEQAQLAASSTQPKEIC